MPRAATLEGSLAFLTPPRTHPATRDRTSRTPPSTVYRWE